MTTLIFLFFSLMTQAHSLMLNVHLPLNSVKNASELCPYTHALRSNLFLKQAFPTTEQISFMRVHSPHLTLFLTDFQMDTNVDTSSVNITALLGAIQNAIQHHGPCEIQCPKSPVIHGAYAMYPISNTKCLRSLSSQIVRALQPFITKPQPVPDWVKQLPLFKKIKKLYLIQKFGSPNVFGDFDPHITVGYDEVTPAEERLIALERAVADLHDGSSCSARLATVAVAEVGVGGTVLQKGIVGRIELYTEGEEESIPGIIWAKSKK